MQWITLVNFFECFLSEVEIVKKDFVFIFLNGDPFTQQDYGEQFKAVHLIVPNDYTMWYTPLKNTEIQQIVRKDGRELQANHSSCSTT